MTPSKWRREGREDYDHTDDSMTSFSSRFSVTRWGWNDNYENYCDGWREAEKAAEEEAREAQEREESPIGQLRAKLEDFNNTGRLDNCVYAIFDDMLDIIEEG